MSFSVASSREESEQSSDINHGHRPPLLFINKNYLLINQVFDPGDGADILVPICALKLMYRSRRDLSLSRKYWHPLSVIEGPANGMSLVVGRLTLFRRNTNLILKYFTKEKSIDHRSNSWIFKHVLLFLVNNHVHTSSRTLHLTLEVKLYGFSNTNQFLCIKVSRQKKE